jgi:CBS domain-containing protein
VLDDGRLVGLVALEDARRVASAERAQRPVSSIMTPAAELATVEPRDDAAEALHTLSQRAVAQLPVLEHGELRGLVRREDLLKWLSLHGGGRRPAWA